MSTVPSNTTPPNLAAPLADDVTASRPRQPRRVRGASPPASRADLLAMPLDDVILKVLDTETTGADEAGDHYGQHKVIEVYVRDWSLAKGRRLRNDTHAMVDPERPIPPAASAVHGYSDADVAGSPTLDMIAPTLTGFVQTWPIVAYNAPFDHRMLEDTPLKDALWIDMYRAAMHIWAVGDKNSKGFPLGSFKQQELRFWLGINKVEGQPHTASADVTVTGMILQHVVKEFRKLDLGNTLEDFTKWVESPLKLRAIPVGSRKMMGKTPSELSDYDLDRVFNPADDLYATYNRFNVDDFCRAEAMRRRVTRSMAQTPPKSSRNSFAWGSTDPTSPVPPPPAPPASPRRKHP